MSQPQAPDPAVPETVPGRRDDIADGWQRLDRRMLLVHPVTELIRFIPVLLFSFIAGARSDNHMWSLAVVGVIVLLALTRWFTTTYRITPDNVELRTGLIQRKKLSVPRTRVRSVDVEADLLHRALGLAVLSIGTGQQAERGDQFKLDSLDARLVPELRLALLAHTADNGAGQQVPAQPAPTSKSETLPGAPSADAAAAPPLSSGTLETVARTHEPVEIAHWRPEWVRYAPLSLTGFAIIAPIVGLAFQYGVADLIFDSSAVQGVSHRGAIFIAATVVVLIIALIVIVSLAACARYLTTYFGLQVLDDGKTLHIRHGLFTTRQTTLDLARLRGATVNEPLLLRLAGAAELEAIMTGTDPRQKLLPQAPRAAVDRTLAQLVDTASELIAAQLTSHGPTALRRRFTRTLGPVAGIAAALLVFSLAGVHVPLWIWILAIAAVPVALALAWDRYRGLGHAVLPATGDNPTWLITRNGSLDRDRDHLESPGIIGWTVRQSFFQRRGGVATIIAASAAGKKRYHIIDIPIDQAWQLIESVTPGQLGSR
ncbi:PH domain-containing protein [Nocardia huaxiensis]|uniref:PH domain-containing protein n=1 Tax=Nocardia huaxiensis TaxID=2755382 RepID=A0A7D6VDH1_9NOCA|nr:PH domain-containing protein [Nocardia huaxiensis]QLY32774.1 PH domain-containing protein [Nocardia huaxiensis]UFS93490.1 PH domain-containing protein [Nocardia huaxiensis]